MGYCTFPPFEVSFVMLNREDEEWGVLLGGSKDHEKTDQTCTNMMKEKRQSQSKV